jgi:hypothetical protein
MLDILTAGWLARQFGRFAFDDARRVLGRRRSPGRR